MYRTNPLNHFPCLIIDHTCTETKIFEHWKTRFTRIYDIRPSVRPPLIRPSVRHSSVRPYPRFILTQNSRPGPVEREINSIFSRRDARPLFYRSLEADKTKALRNFKREFR